MSRPTNWSELGIWPGQHHNDDLEEPDDRQFLAMARYKEVGEDGIVVFARQDDLGTVGDIHPWKFFQTRSRSDRGMGAWSMAFGAVVTSGKGPTTPSSSGGGGGSSGPITPSEGAPHFRPGGAVDPGLRAVPGSPQRSESDGAQKSADVQPIRRDDYGADGRFKPISTKLPKGMEALPKGTIGIAMAGTDEKSQEDLFFPCGDAFRLVCVNWDPPGDMGTLVADLEPAGTISEERTARLQSARRVVKAPQSMKGIEFRGGPHAGGNILAWQGSSSDQDGLAGYAPMFAKLEPESASGGDGDGGDQTTPSEPNPNQGHGAVSTGGGWKGGKGGVGPGNVPGASGSQPGYGQYQAGESGGIATLRRMEY